MELGTSIFLSALVVASAVLYVGTKDRWNWRKIVLWPALAVLVVSVLGGGYAYFEYERQNRPQQQLQLWDVALGDSPADVKFKKGEPLTSESTSVSVSEAAAGDAKTSVVWVYPVSGDSEARYQVQFRSGRVWRVMYVGDDLSAPQIPGVPAFLSLTKLEAALGPPSSIVRSPDDLTRIYVYEHLNLFFGISAGVVEARGVFDPKMGEIRFRQVTPSE